MSKLNAALVVPDKGQVEEEEDFKLLEEDEKDTSKNDDDKDGTASPRVRLVEARLLDDHLQQQSSQELMAADVTGEEIGQLVGGEVFDMLARQNVENNEDIIRDMDSAINDLQTWRQLRDRELALELACIDNGDPDNTHPETEDLTDLDSDRFVAEEKGQEEDARQEYRKADNKAIESLYGLMRSPRGDTEATEEEENKVEAVLDEQTQRLKYSQIQHQIREMEPDASTLKLQQELLDLELAADTNMSKLSTQLRDFEDELDSFLDKHK